MVKPAARLPTVTIDCGFASGFSLIVRGMAFCAQAAPGCRRAFAAFGRLSLDSSRMPFLNDFVPQSHTLGTRLPLTINRRAGVYILKYLRRVPSLFLREHLRSRPSLVYA